MARPVDADPALPRMGPGLVLRMLAKRARTFAPGVPAPLRSRFSFPGPDRRHVARYGAALGFAPGTLPLSYWYLPVQRAHMATLLSDAFPYRLAGIVHVENVLTAHAAPPDGVPLTLATRIQILAPTASGAVYCDLETVGSAHGARIFTCTSKYLARRGQARAEPVRAEPAAAARGAVIDRWTLAPASGRDYARISGDWNPIHLSRWSARLMGLPAPIIHGMHTLARTCAALEKQAGRPVVSISVRFKAPLPLGATAELSEGPQPGRYVVFCGARAAAEGAFTLA